MNLEKTENSEKLELCRLYYIGGFFALPFLWFVNAVWFAKEAFFKPHYEEQAQIKSYVIRSVIGAVIWTIAVLAWIIIFQQNRVAWGATADAMTFIIPQGIA